MGPYVTEQLWHHLPRAPKTEGMAANALMLADWPQMDDNAPLVIDKDAITTFECFQALTRSIRNARAEYNVEQGKKISATVVASGHLKEAIAAGDSAQLVIQDGIEVYLPLSGLIDVEKEKA